MYMVEVVQFNKVRKCRIRSTDYDRVADVFTKAKAEACREVRMFRVSSGGRVLLKYLAKVRGVSIPSEERSSTDSDEEEVPD